MAAVSGALALSAFAVPAAHATGTAPAVTFSGMKVNNGKAVTLGATGTAELPVTGGPAASPSTRRRSTATTAKASRAPRPPPRSAPRATTSTGDYVDVQ
ncbi:hypothetical protein [Streptomyces sp. NPDC051636]|uniref:hypothetical protein n=1 Tax=Streptomyces sp. NPDC051636 TaxID=3365663 RepID=UPI00378C34C6